jgi:hypothetical protein
MKILSLKYLDLQMHAAGNGSCEQLGRMGGFAE